VYPETINILEAMRLDDDRWASIREALGVRVRGYSSRLPKLLGAHSAEDVVQRSVLKYLAKQESFDQLIEDRGGNFENELIGLLKQILWFELVDAARRQHRQQSWLLSDDEVPPVRDEVGYQVCKADFEKVCQILKPEDRQILNAGRVVCEGSSSVLMRQIGESLNLAPKFVSKRMQRIGQIIAANFPELIARRRRPADKHAALLRGGSPNGSE
jgi:DNA-directed RNA polymerase specialized sigma24 family protein